MSIDSLNARFLRRGRLVALLLASMVAACSGQGSDGRTPKSFDEHLKVGELSLVIVGDYFHHSYVRELAAIADALSPRARQVVFCSEKYADALGPFLRANRIANVEYHTFPASSPILTQWARDVAVSGLSADGTTIVVSPDKHARSKADALALGDTLREVLRDRSVRIAPFVFEGGNLAFVQAGDERAVVVGRKVLFDNVVYQRRTWANGYDEASLVDAIAETFGVDRVFVVGRVEEPPETRAYFEYHIDMGMVVLEGNRAVVSELQFGNDERVELAAVIREDHPIVSPFLGFDREPLHALLSRRLETVAGEYDDYAALLDSLGVEVFRTPVRWEHVLGSMSWTNVVQLDNRIVMPLYPDSLHARSRQVSREGGQLRITLDIAGVEEEAFELSGPNEHNRRLYERLGYDVVVVPEYLHYAMGGIHCFVNVLE